MKLNKKISLKDEKEVSNELQGSYGKAVVIMTSNPEELDTLYNKLKDEYDVIMDTELMDNKDYAKVIIRRDNESTDLS